MEESGAMKMVQLKDILKTNQLPVGGTKLELQMRVLNDCTHASSQAATSGGA